MNEDTVSKLMKVLSNAEIHTALAKDGLEIDWTEVWAIIKDSTGWASDTPLIRPL
jgi:hypothetical protein